MNSNNSNIVIEANNLSKTYKLGDIDVPVLKSIDLKIHRGDFLSIMGPSGSGKSTLLYLLGGLDSLTEGSLKINGQELSAMKDNEQSLLRRREIGFVFQFYNLVPNLDVEDNILLPSLLDGKKQHECRERLESILELVGLSDRRKHTPRELSGGQQQRVAIARALINDPEIILADEPIGNLDSVTGTEIMKLFCRINKEKNKTIVQVTHSAEAGAYANRIIHVKDGVIWEKEGHERTNGI